MIGTTMHTNPNHLNFLFSAANAPITPLPVLRPIAISNTSSEKLQGGWGYLLAALTNMGGILLWLVLQYGTLFRTGVAFYPGQALGGILLFALVPSLAIASCLAKYLYKKTGSVYVAAFLNTILMTMMTVANTAIYFQA